MRPNAVEALRGLQGTLMSDITPEVKSLFGQETLQLAQMLLEMLVSEGDGAADNLARDTQTLCELLGRAVGALRPVDSALAEEAAAASAEPTDPSLTVAALTTRNQRLRGLLERLLVLCEDVAESAQASQDLMAVRSEAYRHLREVAARGWSFWDIFSFRERMARLRATGA
ncbi:MAG: hypothetical protein E3J29_05890 [Dehalococcoidia bacterium]|nr:MAG: hypothetical protein E3J29_05890 [Dehalococcoidia bacterium]